MAVSRSSTRNATWSTWPTPIALPRATPRAPGSSILKGLPLLIARVARRMLSSSTLLAEQPPARGAEGDRGQEHLALHQVQAIGLRAEDGQAVAGDSDDENSDEGAEDVELTVADDRCAKERGGEGAQQAAVARGDHSAADP